MIVQEISVMDKEQQKFTLKDKYFCFKVNFKYIIDYLKIVDNEFRCYLTAIKLFILISWIWLFIELINGILGYSL